MSETLRPEDHPLPQRILHWSNLICFAFLIFTGFMIRFPFQGMPMNLMRNLHFVFMFIFIVGGIARGFISIFGREHDFKTLVLTKEDWKNFIPQVLYYLFIRKEEPHFVKYNSMQKLAYIALQVLGVCQVITGFILYRPQTLQKFGYMLGGLETVRTLHYLIMWIFIFIIVVHLYLVFTAAMEQFWFMLFGKIKKSHEH
ncbi:MAG: cytochrome b/b6 domain-containing protein [Peptococcaceae bacterium]|jgi:Ni/Fe-hydrogenase 1 B-type cytochrome subunit|nr:cytochrome b/b6 domain-containing protein [Peptococcaceae bacterium]